MASKLKLNNTLRHYTLVITSHTFSPQCIYIATYYIVNNIIARVLFYSFN